MAIIEIDGIEYQVKDGENLLQEALSVGLNLPYFCWHPAMGSVGACRQCAVTQYHDQDDQTGQMVMACMTPVQDGMRISMEDPSAQEFRGDILELLMTNHPHDCPVCEEGGECHLQDMTVMTGHTFRQYRGKKRTHQNQYLGPFVGHEMNRCIACYRCVRYYRDYAGGHDLEVLGCHNDVYFGRSEEGTLENEFSGNLVEVCPTGVFTDKTLSQCYSRKWDLQTAPSVCTHCSLGCNTSPGERYGQLRRVVNRYHGDINGYFLCDRGRFGSHFVNSEKRILKSLVENSQAINKQTALQHFKTLVDGQDNVIGVGSPRASIEANFALRELVGSDNFYLGFSEIDQELVFLVLDLLRNAPASIPTLKQVESADAVLVLGEDVTNTAPRLALSVRQSIRNRSFDIADELNLPRWQDEAVREAAQQEKSPLFIASCDETPLDEVATGVFHGTPNDIARLGFAVAHKLNSRAPAVPDLTKNERKEAEAIASVLQSAKRPLIITGTGCQSRSVIEAAANITNALSSPDKAFLPLVSECNSIGLALIGGEHFSKALNKMKLGDAGTVVVLENDLYRRGDKQDIDGWFSAAEHVVVIDHIAHPSADKAELVLAAATFVETEGTLVSSEGRAQRFFPALTPTDDIQSSWQWLRDIGAGSDWKHLDDVTQACCSTFPELKDLETAAPKAGFRLTDMKVPRQPHRYSGRTAMLADVNVHEPKQPEDTDSALAFSMEGIASNRPSSLNPGVWSPAWNSNQAVNKFQDEIGGPLKGGNPGVRLFESKGTLEWYSDIPKSTSPNDSKLSVVPVHHIFGSEELSVLSASLAERVPGAYVSLGPTQAQALLLEEGQEIEITNFQSTYRLPLKVSPSLSDGIVGLPSGLPGVPVMAMGTKVTIRKV